MRAAAYVSAIFAAIASPILLIVGFYLYFFVGDFELAVIALLMSLSLDGIVISAQIKGLGR